MGDNKKNIYGLIGYPLTHSFSKNYFNQKFELECINAEYINLEIQDLCVLPDIMENIKNIKGFNVTIPYKEKIIPYLDELDAAAAIIGSVNVIKVVNNSGSIKLKGYNSDFIGFHDSIKPLLQPFDKSALILGSGGVSKSVEYVFSLLGINTTIVSRSKKKLNHITYDDIDKNVLNEHSIIVNTTPLGMFPKIDEAPNIPYDLINKSHLCYDLIYNPEETKFLKLSRVHGARTKNGLEMLYLQAHESWKIWNK